MNVESIRGSSRERSGGESSLLGEFVEGGLVGAGGVVQLGFSWWARVADLGESGAEQVVVGVGEQQRVLQPGVGDGVAAGAGDAFDEAVGAQAPQVVGHLAGGDVLGSFAEQGRDEGAQVTVGESVEQEPVDEQGLQQGVNTVSPKRNPGMRVAWSVTRGVVRSVKAFAPRIGSWLMVWTPSRRRLAVKPSCRRAGRLVSRLVNRSRAGR